MSKIPFGVGRSFSLALFGLFMYLSGVDIVGMTTMAYAVG